MRGRSQASPSLTLKEPSMIKIVKEGEYLLVEEHHLERFLPEGWEIEKEEEILEVPDREGVKTELVSLEKDGDIRLYEINQVKAAKLAGWKEAGGQHGAQSEDHDSRQGAPEGHSGDSEGSGPDLGEQGSGSGSGPEAGPHDEPPEGREDLKPVKKTTRSK